MNLEVLWLLAKVFFAKFAGVVSVGSTSQQSTKVFSTKIILFTNSQKFSSLSKAFPLSKVFHYTVAVRVSCCTAVHVYVLSTLGS